MEDTAILDLYWARDERAITETQKSYGKYCYSIAYHILHDREDTEECLNDTWMRAWNAIPFFLNIALSSSLSPQLSSDSGRL